MSNWSGYDGSQRPAPPVTHSNYPPPHQYIISNPYCTELPPYPSAAAQGPYAFGTDSNPSNTFPSYPVTTTGYNGPAYDPSGYQIPLHPHPAPFPPSPIEYPQQGSVYSHSPSVSLSPYPVLTVPSPVQNLAYAQPELSPQQAAPLKVKLRAPAPNTINRSDLAMDRPTRASRSHYDAVEEVIGSSSRPTRTASLRAQAQLRSYGDHGVHTDLEDRTSSRRKGSMEDEDEPESLPSAQLTRFGRTSKPPARFADEEPQNGGHEYDSMGQSASPPPVRKSSSGRSKRIVHDPDDEESAAPEQMFSPPKTRSNGFGSGAHGSSSAGRSKRHRVKSQHSDAEESFDPDADETEPSQEEDDSDDPIGNFVENDDEDDEELEGYNFPARRKTRSMSHRKRDVKDKVSGGRNLRARNSKPNYALPPADISGELVEAEIRSSAIAAASRPNGVRRMNMGRFGSNKGMWSVPNATMARAMGDPDTSDSVSVSPPMQPRYSLRRTTSDLR